MTISTLWYLLFRILRKKWQDIYLSFPLESSPKWQMGSGKTRLRHNLAYPMQNISLGVLARGNGSEKTK